MNAVGIIIDEESPNRRVQNVGFIKGIRPQISQAQRYLLATQIKLSLAFTFGFGSGICSAIRETGACAAIENNKPG